MGFNSVFNPLNAELNPICHLLALVGAHHILHVSRVRVKGLTVNLPICVITTRLEMVAVGSNVYADSLEEN